MFNVEDIVDVVLARMTKAQELFTALDVSNEVKKDLPLTRHREVRDLVRTKFATHIETEGYAKTPIQVTLADGSSVEALLYHPLVDSWDLDAKYDAQKRSQSSVKTPSPRDPSVVPVNPTNNPVAGLPSLMAPKPMPKIVPAPASNPAAAPAPAAPTSARAAWDQMFKSQPSLFPRS